MKSFYVTPKAYEAPDVTIITICQEDIMTTSSDAFLGEEDALSNDEAI